MIAKAYSRIEATRKRLEMTEILVELFKITPPNILDKVIYLTQGKLAPDFTGIELGLSHTLVHEALYEAFRVDKKLIESWWISGGDTGKVALKAMETKKQTSLFQEQLSVNFIFETMMNIAKASGSGSQEYKIKLLALLFHNSSTKNEIQYLGRLASGKMRLGIADMTIVDALAQTFGQKEDKGKVENAYNICSDLGKVANTLAADGIDGLDLIELEAGTPLRAMLCERLPGIPEIIEKLGKCSFEYKYDGLRVQAHIWQADEGQNIQLYTRQLENVTAQFPDVVESMRGAFAGKECILDGECVPVDINTGEMLPFQEVSHRRGRKTELDSAIKDYPVAVFFFDCLFLDGRELVNIPYPNRRERLASCIKTSDNVLISNSLITDDPDEAESFFQRSLDDGCEGIIAKSIGEESFYRAGSRGWQWVKFKRDYKSELNDTVDLAIIGGFAGKGRRAGTYGALLMATYNHETDTFESVTKLGSGFNDEMLASFSSMLDEHKVKKMPIRVKSKMIPDYWFEPVVVMEVKGAEITLSPIHTCGLDEIRKGNGLAIRFPRFIGLREDKGPEDATTTEEMVSLYNLQLKKLE